MVENKYRSHSGIFSLVQNFAKSPPEEIFVVYYFALKPRPRIAHAIDFCD